MNRRSFLKGFIGLVGVGLIPAVAVASPEPIVEPEKIKAKYKGVTVWDSGYYYAPYIPLMTTNSFNPKG